MFHGVTIEPGETHECALRMLWYITSVALDKDATLNAKEADSQYATAVYYRKDGVNFTLCTLRPRTCEQQVIDLTVDPEEPIEFSVAGKHRVHLSGTLLFPSDDSDDSDDYDEDDEEGLDVHGLEFGDEDDSDDDDSDEDSDEVGADDGVNVSYGTMALATMARGSELNESDDSDDEEWGMGEEEDDEDDDSEEDSDDDLDDSSRFEELTEEEVEALKRIQLASDEKDSKKGKAGTPKQAKTSAKSAGNHDENGEPMAKRKPVFDSPKSAEKKGQQSPAVKKEEKKSTPATTPNKKEQKDAKTPNSNQKEQQKDGAQGVQKLGNGLTAKTIRQGQGKPCKPGQRVFVRYRGRLAQNNREFDSNMTGKPFCFHLGKGEVIKGWDQGVKGMKAGETRELRIPPALGYGARGSPPTIPGNSTLLFTVELLRMK